jgi:hypothetical protein
MITSSSSTRPTSDKSDQPPTKFEPPTNLICTHHDNPRHKLELVLHVLDHPKMHGVSPERTILLSTVDLPEYIRLTFYLHELRLLPNLNYFSGSNVEHGSTHLGYYCGLPWIVLSSRTQVLVSPSPFWPSSSEPQQGSNSDIERGLHRCLTLAGQACKYNGS